MQVLYSNQNNRLLESLLEAQKFKLSEAILREKLTRDLFCKMNGQKSDFLVENDFKHAKFHENGVQKVNLIAKNSEKFSHESSQIITTENLKMSRNKEKKMEMCKICGYRGKWRSEIIRHQKVHQKKRPYKCKLCYWSSKWKNGIVRHIINMHQISADQAENAIHQQEELILIE